MNYSQSRSQAVTRSLPLLLLCCSLLALLSCCITPVSALRYGDPVSMLKRVQHASLRSGWSEMVASEAPKFGVAKSVRLAPLSQQFRSKDFDPQSSLKVSFSFADERFPVSWVTLADGEGHFLRQLDVYFTHAQGDIRSVRWKALYYPDKIAVSRGAEGEVENIQQHINYHWEELAANDPAAAINVVLLVGAAAVFGAAAVILAGWDRTEKKAPGAGGAAAVSAIGAPSRSTRIANNNPARPAAATLGRSNVPHGSHGSSWHAEDVHDA